MDTLRVTQPMYVGESTLLHRWPQAMLGIAVVWLALGSFAGFLVLAIPALVTGLALPWRFAVYDDGIDLWFCFGKRRVLARERVTVRANQGGVVVLPRGAQRVGYPLTNGLVDRDRLLLRDLLRFSGFDVVS